MPTALPGHTFLHNEYWVYRAHPHQPPPFRLPLTWRIALERWDLEYGDTLEGALEVGRRFWNLHYPYYPPEGEYWQEDPATGANKWNYFTTGANNHYTATLQVWIRRIATLRPTTNVLLSSRRD